MIDILKFITSRKCKLKPEDVERLSELRGRHSGKRCFVLGNGPSLLETPVELIKDEISIASNGIFLLFEESGFQPKYYTVEDRLVAEDRSSRINELDGMLKVIPRDLEKHINRDSNTVYVNFIRGLYRGFPRFSSDFARRVFWGGTVTFLNIQLAYHLGCNPIYLIGFDHNYDRPSKEDEIEGNVILSNTDDKNHFHPEYFGKGYRWHDPRVDRMELSYEKAGKFLNKRGVEIYNATAGGMLNVFPRVEYSSLFAS